MKLINFSRSIIRHFCLILFFFSSLAGAEADLKPFVLAAVFEDRQISEISTEVSANLQSAGFEVIGQYSPYDDAIILAFSSEELRSLATRSARGGYGAVMRASLTRNNGKIEFAYTNPLYWANAYRMQADVESIATQLKSVLGHEQTFGSGELTLTASDLRKYHYTFMMEYFDDPSVLNYFDSHEQAVTTVRENLAKQAGASTQVFELKLGSDTNGKQMTLFGVALNGTDKDDCSSDAYIMTRIDKDTPRHSAHLPYEILVYGDHAEALYGRFRIAISWPHLPMMASDTGATFFSIMCAPGAIQDSLTKIAGGVTEYKSEK
ncbi:MAG: hypothetical protein OES20_13065 [Gammaproteobacteria bacterium]|nr:hypothetical protein [Gammaproteobacteria bacterium]MDH3859609.1 hypothetical protein [Gammaproteobacteria bacterium]